jgi:hypothetical protein
VSGLASREKEQESARQSASAGLKSASHNHTSAERSVLAMWGSNKINECLGRHQFRNQLYLACLYNFKSLTLKLKV